MHGNGWSSQLGSSGFVYTWKRDICVGNLDNGPSTNVARAATYGGDPEKRRNSGERERERERR